MKNCFSILLLVSTVFLIGCFPVELSVSKDGQVLIPRQEGFYLLKTADAAEAKLIYSPKGEKPVWAAFTPDASSVLALSQGKGDMGDTNYTLRRMGPDASALKALMTASNLLYARVSPDGAKVSLARASDTESKTLAKKMPELLVVSTADGAKKPLLSDVAAVHRWTTDGKGILAVHVTSREKDGDQYVGKLVIVAVADGKTTDAASVLAGDKIYMDVSPDGNKVLLTALKVLPTAQAVPAKSDEKPSLFEIDLRSGQVRLLKQKALLGVYSPKGDKVLAATEGGEGTTELSIASGDMKEFKTIATDAAKSAGSSEIYPGWLNNDTVLYVGLRAVYGTEAKNFQLMALSADGKTRRNFQPTIDQAVEQK
ncbi:MAG: hypothetical protein ABFD92_16130 [Planctomycetaceae bacterium]|nr:hypothetical protein [Planctomycetaceae bacterium]